MGKGQSVGFVAVVSSQSYSSMLLGEALLGYMRRLDILYQVEDSHAISDG